MAFYSKLASLADDLSDLEEEEEEEAGFVSTLNKAHARLLEYHLPQEIELNAVDAKRMAESVDLDDMEANLFGSFAQGQQGGGRGRIKQEVSRGRGQAGGRRTPSRGADLGGHVDIEEPSTELRGPAMLRGSGRGVREESVGIQKERTPKASREDENASAGESCGRVLMDSHALPLCIRCCVLCIVCMTCWISVMCSGISGYSS